MSELISITGGSPDYHRAIRASLRWFPSWYVRASGVVSVEVNASEVVRKETAIYSHTSKAITLSPNLGVHTLRQALAHELAHGVDDQSDTRNHPHYFSASDVWLKLHAQQSSFDLEKQRNQPVEYFAAQLAKHVTMGSDRFRARYPEEYVFFSTWVVPVAKTLR